MQWLAFVTAKIFIRGCQLAPLPLLRLLGAALGTAAYLADFPHRRVALANLRRAFPEKSARELHAIARKNFVRFAQNMLEALHASAWPAEKLLANLEIHGVERVRAAAAQGRGIVFILAHLGNWEFLAQSTRAVPELRFSTTYRRLKNPRVDALVVEMRRRCGIELIERREGFKKIAKKLQRGEAAGILADQNAGAHGIFVEFFGRPASVTPAPAILARLTGAVLLPVYVSPAQNRRWKIEVDAPIPTENRAEAEILRDTIARLEKVIRRDPANWFWMHNRWKHKQFLDSGRDPSAFPRTSKPFRILVRGTNWLGDAVMTMPAVAAVRKSRPDAHITLFTPKKIADLWRENPNIDEIITEPPKKSQHFDAAILFPNSFRAALEAWRAGIPIRVGYTGHWRRWLLTRTIREPAKNSRRRNVTVDGKTFSVRVLPDERHQVHRYLDLVQKIGAKIESTTPKIWIRPDEIAATERFVPKNPNEILLGLNAGAEYGPAKRWPADRFAALAAQISQKISAKWLIFGGKNDGQIANEIEKRVPTAINLAGKTTLRELCALLSRCRLLVTNDTGPMHVAAALGVPVVAIFGSTDPNLTGPLGENHTILLKKVECWPCFLRECPIDFRCMTRISVDEVAEAVLKKLQ
jgi:heptosyltransferase-2